MWRRLSGDGHSDLWRLTGVLVALALAVSFGAAPAAVAKLHKGNWVVTFSGRGSGTFDYSWPSWSDSNGNCLDDSESYTLNYSYHWGWTDVVADLGEGTIQDNWTGGGNTSSNTVNGNQCPGAPTPSGSCTGVYRAPTGNDSGLSPELTVDKAGHRVSVQYTDGGLPLNSSTFGSNCGNADPDQYDGNIDGFVETGTITAKALFPLAKAEKGKTLSTTIARSSSESCSSATACSPDLAGGDDEGPLTPGQACQPTQEWAGSPPDGGVVTCSARESYSGKLTVRYVK